MAHSRAETMRVEQRRQRVAAMVLQGLRPSEIARRLSMDNAAGRVKVSQDLRHIRESWKASAIRDFDEAKGRVLAEIALAKRAAWRAWGRSLRGKDGERREGNPRYLNLLLSLLAKEAEVLGLVSANPSVVVQQVAGANAAAVTMTADQRRDAVKAILVAAARPGGADSEAAQLLALMDQQAGAGAITVPAGEADAEPTNGDAVPQYGLKELPTDEDDVEPLFG